MTDAAQGSPAEPPPPVLRFVRAGGIEPSDFETVDVGADGLVVVRRTVAGSRVGVFERTLDSAERALLGAAAELAADAGPRGYRARGHDAVETVEVGVVSGRFDPYEQPDGPWEPALTALRSLLEDPHLAPRAALTLAVAASGKAARIGRAGKGEIAIVRGTATAMAQIVREGMVAREWPVALPELSAAPPAGWSLDLLLAPPEPAGAGYVEVTLDITAGFAGEPARPRRIVAASTS